jgi:hypothetical protein
MIRGVVLALAAVACVPLCAQVTPYGNPTPAGCTATFDSAGQIPFAGNGSFELKIHNHANANGGGIVIGPAPASAPFGATTLLVDFNGAIIVTLSPGVTIYPVPIPSVPGIAGATGYAQAGVFDSTLTGGFGLTNAIQVAVLPDRTPTRAYFGGQNFAGPPGIMASLDLSVQPPVFRATGSVGFAGNITNNFPNKIAVATGPQLAYALGNSSTNQFVRAFNISSDPAGIVTWSAAGDIPTAGQVSTIVGQHDMEVTSDGHYVFTTSTVSSNVALEVFDTSGMPASVPTAAIQTISYAGASSGAVGLELAPAGNLLAVVNSVDSQPAVRLYTVTPGAPQPLSLYATISLPIFSGSPYGYSTPSDVHFSEDGHLLLVSGAPVTSGGNAYFSLIDLTTNPPVALIPGQVWAPTSGNLWCHGSALAVMNGAPVGVFGAEGSGASYYVYDLNPVSPTFGALLSTFTTNPGGNISNHRMHSRQNIVVATDGTGATVDCQWVDVIDLDQPIAGGFAHWRVQMPTHATFTPSSISCIPRDFDMF